MEKVKNCPHCNYSTDTEKGLNIHIGRVHGREENCRWCDEVFTYQPSADNKFCSESCYMKYKQSESDVQKTNCLECGETFLYHPSAESGKFCSRKCFYETDITIKKGSYKQREIRETTCDTCGETFSYYPKKTKGLFCSQECFYQNDKEWEKPGRNTVERDKYDCYTCGEIVERLDCDVPNPKRVFCSHKCRGVWVGKSEKFRSTDTIYVEETDREVRSGWEADIDRMLNKSPYDYEYESEIFDIGKHSYIPDFKVGDNIIEVKGQVTERDNRRAKAFMKHHPEYKYIVVGNKIPCDVFITWDDKNELLEVINE